MINPKAMTAIAVFIVAASASLLVASNARAERLKDLGSIQGVRPNPLIGYGLVVGLDGTGDGASGAPFTEQTLRNMLNQFGITVPPGVNIRPKNVAAVSVTAKLPPFAKPGQSIDITAASLGDAKSLRGGSLLMTTLKGADGQIYALAQGELVVGGLGVQGSDGSKVTINVPSVGRIPNGATVERSVASPFASGDSLVFNLHAPDFTTAMRVADAVNVHLGGGVARAEDGTSVRVRAPAGRSARVALLAELENVQVEPGDAPARVIVNSRSGTVVISAHVRVMPAAVTHGNLSVTIAENPQVSQPEALSQGNTQVTPQTEINVEETGSRMFLFDTGVSLDTIVRAVNQVGAAPGDLVAILEALKQAGALRAQLIVI